MENKWEQPEGEKAQAVNTEEDQENFLEFQDLDEGAIFNDGSLGKFKNIEALMCAYNNLQAEFTRKCQKLKQLEKEFNLSEVKKEETSENESLEAEQLEKQTPPEDESLGRVSSNASEEEKEKIIEENAETLSAQAEATDEFSQKENTKQKLMDDFNDKEFAVNFVASNKDVRDEILKQYLEEIAKTNLPKVISSPNSSGIALETPPKPKNLSEAKTIISQMFL